MNTNQLIPNLSALKVYWYYLANLDYRKLSMNCFFFLTIIDTISTVLSVNYGSIELNPIVAILLEINILLFLLLKIWMIAIALIVVYFLAPKWKISPNKTALLMVIPNLILLNACVINIWMILSYLGGN